MIKVESGILEITEPSSADYHVGSFDFTMDDRTGTTIKIGLDILAFAISVIAYNEKIKQNSKSDIGKLLKKMDKKVKQVEESKKRIADNKKMEPLISQYWKEFMDNNKNMLKWNKVKKNKARGR